ncbi:hypothetical protein H671_3g10756 [Cricetulus griseus]|nr:hypothetical protein H671_3g10756 [Cricetulus griseus]
MVAADLCPKPHRCMHGTDSKVCLWRSENNLWDQLSLSTNRMGPGSWTQIFGIRNPAIYDQESLGDCARLYAKTLTSIKFKRPRNWKAGYSFGSAGASEPPGPRSPAALRAFPQEASVQQIPLC